MKFFVGTTRRIGFMFLVLFIPAFYRGIQLLAASQLAIALVTIIDVTDGPTQSDMTVIASGSRITAVGSATQLKIPPGTYLIEGQGKNLIPRLEITPEVIASGPIVTGMVDDC